MYYDNDTNENVLNAALEVASRGGNVDVVKILLEKGADDIEYAMLNAVYYGNVDLVKYLIEKGAKDFNYYLNMSKGEGHSDIIKFFEEKLK